MDLMGRDDVLVNPWKTMPKRNLQSFVNAIVLLATSPQQYAYDARFHGVYHGAMTYFALQAIREANYKLTYAQLQKRLLYLLNKAGYPQRPCLEGKAADKKREIFR
jgi:hypothetical protein